MSDNEDVLSGVPQGMVLASVLFMIMVPDIDKEKKGSLLHCFADNNRVS